MPGAPQDCVLAAVKFEIVGVIAGATGTTGATGATGTAGAAGCAGTAGAACACGAEGTGVGVADGVGLPLTGTPVLADVDGISEVATRLGMDEPLIATAATMPPTISTRTTAPAMIRMSGRR